MRKLSKSTLIAILIIFILAAPYSQASRPTIQHIAGHGPIETSVLVSQFIYNNTKPGVVLLVSDDDYATALVATSLIHHPRNGPLLFTKKDGLPDIVYQEIVRLGSMDGMTKIKIYAIGDLSDNVISRARGLGQVEVVYGGKAEETAYLIDRMLGHPRTIMVISAADTSAACAAAWAAHAGTPILLVGNDTVPKPAEKAIDESYRPDIMIIGNETSVSRDVEEELRSMDVTSVDRISGDSPAELSVNFALYKKGLFGWGKNVDAANSFSIVKSGDWQNSINAALLAHLYGHQPILFTAPNMLDMAVSEYLDSINQPETPVPDHAVIVGEGISKDAEMELHSLLTGNKNIV